MLRGVPPSGPPTSSVVVPVRDDARELQGLLEALGRQTRPPREIIVVDNGSRDRSAEVAREAGCTVIHEATPGIPAAAAAGYDAARGDLIVRCDADSRPGPGWIAAHERAHARGGRRAVIVTGPSWFLLPAPLGALAAAMYLGMYMLATGAALGHLPAFGTTMSMRRQWWRSVRESVSRSEEVHDDMDLSFQVGPGEHVRLAWSARVAMSPRALRPGRAALRRVSRAICTLRRNWRVQRPWERWMDRCSARHRSQGISGHRAPRGEGPER